MEIKVYKVKVSLHQKIKMLNFMKGHEDFARGRVTGPDAARQRIKLLEELAELLNACGSGANKTPKKWLKCWQDWRCDTKAKALKLDKFINGTGGGPCPSPLTELEESLMEFCGREMVAGVPDEEDALEIQHYSPPQEEKPTSDEGLLHEEVLMHEESLSHEEDHLSEDVPVKKPKKKIITKRKYVPETEIETQCVDDPLFEQNSQSWEPVSGTYYVDYTRKDSPTCTMDLSNTTKDSAMCTEQQTVEVQAVTVRDIDSCKYFGQFVSNELLRFNITERYAIMQNIIGILKK